jgi:hypothetical protein
LGTLTSAVLLSASKLFDNERVEHDDLSWLSVASRVPAAREPIPVHLNAMQLAEVATVQERRSPSRERGGQVIWRLDARVRTGAYRDA